jgi:hypothetical protein
MWGSFVEAPLYAAVAMSVDLAPEHAVKRDNFHPPEYLQRFEMLTGRFPPPGTCPNCGHAPYPG